MIVNEDFETFYNKAKEQFLEAPYINILPIFYQLLFCFKAHKKNFSYLIISILPLLFIAKAYSFQNEEEHELLKIPEEIAPMENQNETKDYSFDSNARKLPGSEYKWLPMWVTDSPLNIPRASPAVAVENGFIYVLGGGIFDQDHIFHSSVEYTKIQPDGSLGEWRLTSPMKTKRMFAAAIAANGYIYVIGSFNANILNS